MSGLALPLGAFDLLVPLDGTELRDILPHQIAVVGLEWVEVQSFLNVLDCGVQIALRRGFVHAPGLRRKQQGLPAVVQLLRLLLGQGSMRHGRGYVVSQLENGVAPLLRLSRLEQENRGYSERGRPGQAHSP